MNIHINFNVSHHFCYRPIPKFSSNHLIPCFPWWNPDFLIINCFSSWPTCQIIHRFFEAKSGPRWEPLRCCVRMVRCAPGARLAMERIAARWSPYLRRRRLGALSTFLTPYYWGYVNGCDNIYIIYIYIFIYFWYNMYIYIYLIVYTYDNNIYMI